MDCSEVKGREPTWWDQLIMTCQRQGKPKIVNWEKMSMKLRETFLPYNYTQLVYQRLQNFFMEVGILMITQKFFELVLRNELNE